MLWFTSAQNGNLGRAKAVRSLDFSLAYQAKIYHTAVTLIVVVRDKDIKLDFFSQWQPTQVDRAQRRLFLAVPGIRDLCFPLFRESVIYVITFDL